MYSRKLLNQPPPRRVMGHKIKSKGNSLIDAKHHYTLGYIRSEMRESQFLKWGAIKNTQKHGIGPWLLYFLTD